MAEALTDYARQLRAGSALDLLLRVTVGGGKSQAAILAAPAILAAGRQAKPEGALFYLTPRHDLNAELQQRFADAHPGLRVRIWRGMDADDPARQGSKMCLDPELPQAAADAGLARTTPCGACPLKGDCGYRQQGAEAADVWLAAHNLALGEKPGVLPDAAVLALDESFTSAALAGMDSLHLIELALSELLDTRTGAVTGLARDRLLFLRRRVFEALTGHGEGGMLREVFTAAGLTADSAKEWQDLEWQVKPKVELAGDLPRDAILDRLHEAKTAGFRRLRPVLARYLGELLNSDAARSVNVTVAPGSAVLRFAWRTDFATWAQATPKVFLDGTSHPDLLRVWSPDVQVVDVEVSAPHQRVRQVPREFGRRFFTGNPENVRRLADLVMVELASTNGGVLLVAQQAVLDLLRPELLRQDPARYPPRFASGGLPARLHLAHHGAVTGMNRWENVDRAVIVGRPAVNRRDGERLAEVIAGGPVGVVADQDDNQWPSVPAGIRMADSTGAPVQQAWHPDPLVEAIRWSISEGAVLQAVGRARGVQRGAARPVQVTVLANMALPLTVHEVMTWEAIQPDRLDVAAAEAALNGRALPLAPADLHQARPDQWKTPQAAKRCLQDREDREGKRPEPLIGSPYKAFGPFASLTFTRYRKGFTGGRWSLALVPQEAGQAALEAEVGALAAYDAGPPAAPPAAPAPHPSPPPPEASMPVLPPAAAPSPPGAEQPGLHPAALGLRRVGAGFRPPLTVENGLTVHLRPAAPPVPLRIWEVGWDRLQAEVRHVR
jgi:putative DNA primase/helicase